MKKGIFWLFLFVSGFSLYAQTNSNKKYFFFQPITGVSINQNDNALIYRMLSNETKGREYTILDTPYGADYILYGRVSPYNDNDYFEIEIENEYLRNGLSAVTTYSYNTSLFDPWNQMYLFQLMLKDVETNEEVLLQNLYYSSVDDLYNFFPLIVHNLFDRIGYEPDVEESAGPGLYASDSDDWQNKWLYLRLSVDFPVTFYLLKKDGLIDSNKAYAGSFGNSTEVSPLDNKVMFLPALTIGFEIHFLNWLSIEPKFQTGWEHLNNTEFLTMAAGLELKFPIKVTWNFMFEPYAAVSYPILIPVMTSKIFDSFSLLALGGGIQFDVKLSENAGLFFDINYMYSLGDVGIHNPDEMHPNPPVIMHQRAVLGLGLGLKIGFSDRKKKILLEDD